MLRSWTAANFDSGRVFAAARASDWSPLRRLVFAGSSPLIPAVRLMRILPVLARSGPPRRALPRSLPALVLGLSLDALGQMVCYAVCAGRFLHQLGYYEFHRERHLARCDEQLLQEVAA
jgi:hypothetical protein